MLTDGQVSVTERDALTPVDSLMMRRMRTELASVRKAQRFMIIAAIALALIQAATVLVLVWHWFEAKP